MQRRTTVVIGGLVVGAMALVGTVYAATAAGVLWQSAGVSSPRSGTTMAGYRSTGMMGTPTAGGMMGSGASGNRWSNCYPGGMVDDATRSHQQGKSLTLAQAQQRVQRFVAGYGTASLAVDEVMEFQKNFYAIVKDRSTGHGAFEVLVDKGTGAVCPEYGPAMMWNTQYGMTHGMMGCQQPAGTMTVAPAQATRLAAQWLHRNRPGTATEVPEQFPGYYTVHILRGGTVTGMLSVNGFTGQVWYHTWHGALIRMEDLRA